MPPHLPVKRQRMTPRLRSQIYQSWRNMPNAEAVARQYGRTTTEVRNIIHRFECEDTEIMAGEILRASLRFLRSVGYTGVHGGPIRL